MFLGILAVRIWYPISQFLFSLDWSNQMTMYSLQIGSFMFIIVAVLVVPYRIFTEYSKKGGED